MIDYYKGAREAEDAMAILARWISGNRKIKVQYHNSTAIDADPDTGTIRIPRMACASGITEEALMLLRGRVYHEAGHIDESTAVKRPEYPKVKALFEIWNALEDRRMEAAEANKHVGCKVVFNWNTDFYNRDIAGKISSGTVDAPLWEALCAMGLMTEGRSPLWKLTPKAKAYADAAYQEFVKVHTCRDSRDTLKLAEAIYKILKEKNDELKQNSPKNDNKKSQSQKQKSEKGEKNQEPQSGGASDMDDDSESGDDEESKDSEEKESKSGKSKKSDKDEKDDKGKESKSGKSKKGDEEGDKEDAEGKGEDEDKAEDSEDEEDSEGNGKASEEESDKESEEEGSGEGEGGDEGEEGDEDSEDEDSDEKGSDSGDDTGDESSEGEESGADEGSGEGKGGDKGQEGEDSEGDDADGNIQPGDFKYEPKDEEAKGGEGTGDDERNLDEECNGVSREAVVNENLERLFGEMNPSDLEYTSRRDLDQHRFPAMNDSDKAEFIGERQEISVQVATMTRAMEQALRSLSRCKKQPYLRHGKIDKKRLVAIAKSLSKEVFYRKQEGIDLNVAVEITIDESGSMGNYKDVRLLAIAIGEALQAIGIPFEITGSTTAYGSGSSLMPPMDGFARTNPIVYNHYKTFDEKWEVVRSRLVHTSAYEHNIDGEVVEYAAFRLAGRREHRKIIFSLSDGEPCGGHNNDYLMAKNLKRVCDRVRKAGIEVYGFGIGTMGPEPLYGKKFFILLEKASTMGPEFVKRFAAIVTGGMVRV